MDTHTVKWIGIWLKVFLTTYTRTKKILPSWRKNLEKFPQISHKFSFWVSSTDLRIVESSDCFCVWVKTLNIIWTIFHRARNVFEDEIEGAFGSLVTFASSRLLFVFYFSNHWQNSSCRSRLAISHTLICKCFTFSVINNLTNLDVLFYQMNIQKTSHLTHVSFLKFQWLFKFGCQ